MNKVPTAEEAWKLFTQLKPEQQEIILVRMQELVEKRDAEREYNDIKTMRLKEKALI